MKHPVVWFEVMGENGEGLRSFYGRLFDWKIGAGNPMKYGMVEAANGRGIPGGVGQLGEIPPPKVTVYVATDSVETFTRPGDGARGPVLMKRTALSNRLRYQNEKGEESDRVVRPLGAFFWGKTWTLAAWCELRNDFRNFRLDRIAERILDD